MTDDAPPTDKIEPATEEIERDLEAAGEFFITLKVHALTLFERLADQLGSASGLYQAAAIAAALFLGWALGRPLRASIDRLLQGAPEEGHAEADQFESALRSLAAPFAATIILWLAVPIFQGFGLSVSLMRIAASLITAWIIIRFVASFVRDPFWSRTFALFAWIAAALNILRLLGPTIDFLDSLRIPLGGGNAVSIFDILWAAALATMLLWSASFAARIIRQRLNNSTKLTPSVRGLLGQLIQIGLIAGAILLALSIARVNLTGLAVLTGAIGVGIGFGLQSIFQNFIAGIIILLEKTLKVGDFVDLESGITGEVREINVRSTLVTTNDNVDILVPNAEFISKRVTNWTLREAYRRLRIPFGVAYGTDKELVKKAALEAGCAVPYTLTTNPKRKPDVWLVGFGESSLDFELVVWLTDDAVSRPGAVNAAYNWEIETALGKYGIEIPFPQRDLHIIPPKAPIDQSVD